MVEKQFRESVAMYFYNTVIYLMNYLIQQMELLTWNYYNYCKLSFTICKLLTVQTFIV